uniref:Uncharacterized protein n=1 Tax=Dromaius novaehollandiae TaxID=8790 RepID=A0A8C4P209_DRONO
GTSCREISCSCSWSTSQSGIILQRNPSINNPTGDSCQSLVSPKESGHVATVLSHWLQTLELSSQQPSARGVRFYQAASNRQKRLMHCDFCTKCGFRAVNETPDFLSAGRWHVTGRGADVQCHGHLSHRRTSSGAVGAAGELGRAREPAGFVVVGPLCCPTACGSQSLRSSQ